MNKPPNVSDDPVLRATGLALGYRRRTVLRDVQLLIRPGERWFVVGPNGHGKTTLMRGLLGLIRPSAGELWRNPRLMSPSRVGFVPQRSELNPTLPTTVREFVSLGTVGQSMPAAQRVQRLDLALRQVRLTELADASFWALSGGQRQRAALARALIRLPGVLLLDEPTNGLDIPSEESLMHTCAELNASTGLTTIVVTHRIDLAARFGTHAALVHGGAVYAGVVDDVLDPDRLHAVYGLAMRVERGAGGGAALRIGGGGA